MVMVVEKNSLGAEYLQIAGIETWMYDWLDCGDV